MFSEVIYIVLCPMSACYIWLWFQLVYTLTVKCKHMCSWSDQLVLFLSVASWTSDGQYFAVGMQNGSVSIRNKVNVCE